MNSVNSVTIFCICYSVVYHCIVCHNNCYVSGLSLYPDKAQVVLYNTTRGDAGEFLEGCTAKFANREDFPCVLSILLRRLPLSL